ncbi:MAG: peptide chain release factor 1 [Candidatus Eisenbacteria bacterium]
MSDLLRTQGQLKEQLEQITAQQIDPKVLGDAREMKRLGRERVRLEQLLHAMDQFARAEAAVEEYESLLSAGDDPDLVALAKEEIAGAREALAAREVDLKLLLTPRDPNDSKNAMVEIRAGTGGEEAALFARDIYRMYLKYAEAHGFRIEEMSSNATELGGLKEVVFMVEGEEPYATFKFESGVHRVQRVPETEASGRIHTSAVSVVVLAEAEDVEVAIDEKDLKIDVFRSSGPGGQSVNTTDSAVRIRPIPSGLVVQCQDERSQLKNKNKALKILRARLLDMKESEQTAATAAARKSMVSTGDRSAKIRTYNFPQGRVTDHRIGLTLYNLQAVLEGSLGELIQALSLADSEARLQASTAVS